MASPVLWFDSSIFFFIFGGGGGVDGFTFNGGGGGCTFHLFFAIALGCWHREFSEV